jgi:hypothetical protein
LRRGFKKSGLRAEFEFFGFGSQARGATASWRWNLNIKGPLLGSCAVIVSAGAALAADVTVIAEPEPVEYVRVCDAYGAGFFYIPGTETCLKISGYVR